MEDKSAESGQPSYKNQKRTLTTKIPIPLYQTRTLIIYCCIILCIYGIKTI